MRTEGMYKRRDIHMEDIYMRRHAHEGDMRTKETYTRKEIHMEGHTDEETYVLPCKCHTHDEIFTQSDIHKEQHINEGTCT